MPSFYIKCSHPTNYSVCLFGDDFFFWIRGTHGKDSSQGINLAVGSRNMLAIFSNHRNNKQQNLKNHIKSLDISAGVKLKLVPFSFGHFQKFGSWGGKLFVFFSGRNGALELPPTANAFRSCVNITDSLLGRDDPMKTSTFFLRGQIREPSHRVHDYLPQTHIAGKIRKSSSPYFLRQM